MTTPDNANYTKLVDKLRELFELDKADLDFGIYRIISQRQDEIDDFLRNRLRQTVAELLSSAQGSQQAELQAELGKAEQSVRDLGMNPDQVPKVQELREKLRALGNPQRMEDEVYEHLYRFFSRYYEEGDFISLRRVSRKAKYAIPYNGEEVKLHWANADQYYIKSSENFRDYRFRLADGRGVHFKLLDADTSRDNTKGDKRFFMLAADEPVVEEGDELRIHFHYTTTDEKKVTDVEGKAKAPGQGVFNALALRELGKRIPGTWQTALSALLPTKANPKRTLLEKHLTDYTAKNSFDYFIHKDFGGFLRNELDFYIKNEVMFLDDIEDADAPKVESYLRTLKAIRRVAGKVIDFLAQLEDFQKKLWLKKKFVVQCDYCLTLDRVPGALYPAIADNPQQVAEWRKWNFIDAKTRVDVAYLQQHPYLLIDTQFYPTDFKLALLESIEDIDAQCDGLLINADNFQALNLLQDRYREQVKCIYIDPPYNTGQGDFCYKDNLQHSSWLAMLLQVIVTSSRLFTKDSSTWINLDDREAHKLQVAISSVLGDNKFVADIAWQKVYSPRMDARQFSTSFDHLFVFADKDDWIPNKLSITPDLSQFPHISDEGRRYRSDPLRKWGMNSLRTDRPNLWFAIKSPCGVDVYPVKPDGKEGYWRWQQSKVMENYEDLDWIDKGNGLQPYLRQYADKSTQRPVETLWLYSDAGSTHESNEELKGLFGSGAFSTPKPTKLIKKVALAGGELDSIMLDYFAGSGTTGHAVINLNREDGGSRKYILVEQGAYFDTVLKPRIQKVVYSENWKDGKPVESQKPSPPQPPLPKVEGEQDAPSLSPSTSGRGVGVRVFGGISHCFKYMKLESYEDTLNNLELRRSGQQQSLLDQKPELHEDYLLNYMLDIETKGSLLNIDAFTQPFAYRMQIATDSAGETRQQNVDLIETFNYLLGLTVHTQRQDTVQVTCAPDEHGIWQRQQVRQKAQPGDPDTYTFLTLHGTLPDGKSALIVWRILNDFTNPVSKTCHNIALDYYLLERKRINPREGELDVIYVNGDNTLPNIRTEAEHWKVRLIEEEFQRLMFSGEA